MEHDRKLKAERCRIPDFASYEAGLDKAQREALALRGLLEKHLGPLTAPVNEFGHDINNATMGLSSVVTQSVDNAPPLMVIDTLLSDYAQRVENAFNNIRSHVQDKPLLEKIDALQETIDALLGHLRLARENHTHPTVNQLSTPKILGTIGPQGQPGIWL